MSTRIKTSQNLSQAEKRKYYAILFDLDGTIIKSTYQPREAKTALINKLKELGVNVSNISLNETTMNIIDKAKAQIKKKTNLSLKEVNKTINEILDKFDIEALSRSELIHDAKSILNSLRNKGLKLGIVTNSGRKGVKLTLENFNMKNYFDVIVTRNDIEKMKPSGEGIIKAVTSLGCKRNQIMYVGDSWVDIRSAKNAGVIAVAITGGLSTSEKLRQESPDIMLNSLDELLDIVQSMGKPKCKSYADR
jgi:HAD superfamily hydrolase (TIGR01549 family)